MKDYSQNLAKFPRAYLSHLPTPLEPMPNLQKAIGAVELYIKRDDCTGLGMGGNKARQLEYYLGQAKAENADTILITGAVQSNYVRMAAAAARKNGMECHIQLEQRVAGGTENYHHSGNVLLDRLFGATLHHYEQGEDESGADKQLDIIAANLKSEGKTPYVIHLGADHPPLGALGYVSAAMEMAEQIEQENLQLDGIIVPTGSGATHSGLLFGLCMIGVKIPVHGICVRRSRDQQVPRIAGLCQKIADLIGISNPVGANDIRIHDDLLAPGYGKMNNRVEQAIKLTAQGEGIILDPVYSGKTMAGLIKLVEDGEHGDRHLFIHTGGQPAIFGYGELLEPILSPRLSKA